MVNAAEKLEYPGQHQTEATAAARRYHDWILREFKPYIGNAVAEVGAGTGHFSERLLNLGIEQLDAFEPSENMFPLLHERLRSIPNARAVKEFFGRGGHTSGFDTVLYVNVLEHIEDDVAELARAYETLKPGGHLLVFVPALQWLHGDLDRRVGHHRRYYKRDLVAKVREAGFTIAKAKYFDSAGVLPWYVGFVLLDGSITVNKASLYDAVAVPIVSRIERFIPPPIGKNVLVVGRKS